MFRCYIVTVLELCNIALVHSFSLLVTHVRLIGEMFKKGQVCLTAAVYKIR